VNTSSTSYLTLLDSTSTLLIASLLSRQSLSPLSGPTTLVLPTSPAPTRVEVTINKPVSMPQLQRLKRQFTQLNARAGKEFGQETIARMFADYVEGQLR
jgi:protein KTI12